HPAPRRITPRDASISHVVGTTWANRWKIHGIESTGNTYPDRKIDGMTVPMTNCPASSVVLALVEIHRPMAYVVRTNGTAMATSVKNVPWIGTRNTITISRTMLHSSKIVSPK